MTIALLRQSTDLNGYKYSVDSQILDQLPSNEKWREEEDYIVYNIINDADVAWLWREYMH